MDEDKKSDAQPTHTPFAPCPTDVPPLPRTFDTSGNGQFTDYQKVKLPMPRTFDTSGNGQFTDYQKVKLPMPREFNGKKYYGLADVAKIIGVSKQTVWQWQTTLYFDCPLFTADERAHDGRYL